MRCGRKLNYVLTVKTVVARNAKRVVVALGVGSSEMCFCLKSVVRRSVIGSFGRTLDVFIFLLIYEDFF